MKEPQHNMKPGLFIVWLWDRWAENNFALLNMSCIPIKPRKDESLLWPNEQLKNRQWEETAAAH